MSVVTFYEPQAAAGGTLEYAEEFFLTANYIAQEKLDGARYVLHKYLDGSVKIYSRRTSVKTGLPVDKTQQLIHLAEEFDTLFPPGSVIDGEVIAPGANKHKGRPQNTSSNLVTRVTGSLPEKARAHQLEHGFVQFAAFDCLAYEGEDVTTRSLKERMDFLLTLNDGKIQRPFIFFLPYIVGEDQKRAAYKKIVARGGEGIILKDLYSPYQCGKRNNSWVKVKKERTFDVVFMGVELANETSTKKSGQVSATRIAGQAGAIRFGQMVTQEPLLPPVLTELGTVSGFDDATREDITKNAAVYTRKHRVFEVRAQEQFETGALRHPRFVQWRDDKVATDCLLRKDES